jgi:hypothetical protein
MEDEALVAAGDWLAREWAIPLEEAREYVERWSVEEDAKDLVAFFFLHCDYPGMASIPHMRRSWPQLPDADKRDSTSTEGPPLEDL